MNAVLSIQDAYDQDQGIFSVLIKKEVRGSGLLFLYKKTPRLTRGSVNAMRLTRNPPTVRIELRFANCNQTKEEDNMGLNDINSLSHS